MATRVTTHWVWESYAPVRGSGSATEIAGFDGALHTKLLRGNRIAKVPRLVVKEATSGRFRDELGSYTGIQIVSPIIRAVLDDTADANLQFIPVRIASKPDLEYFAVNVLDSYPAMDLERSRYELHEGTEIISRTKKLVLRKIPGDAPPIFHVAEHPVLVLVNADLHGRLVKATKHPGVLTPAEQYRNEY